MPTSPGTTLIGIDGHLEKKINSYWLHGSWAKLGFLCTREGQDGKGGERKGKEGSQQTWKVKGK